jgi:hypothetical protein
MLEPAPRRSAATAAGLQEPDAAETDCEDAAEAAGAAAGPDSGEDPLSSTLVDSNQMKRLFWGVSDLSMRQLEQVALCALGSSRRVECLGQSQQQVVLELVHVAASFRRVVESTRVQCYSPTSFAVVGRKLTVLSVRMCAFALQLLHPQVTLQLCFLACALLREAVTCYDIITWALDAQLPFLGLPDIAKTCLSGRTHCGELPPSGGGHLQVSLAAQATSLQCSRVLLGSTRQLGPRCRVHPSLPAKMPGLFVTTHAHCH